MRTPDLGAVRRWHRDADTDGTLALSRATLAVLAVGFAAAGAAGVAVPPRAQMAVYLVGMIGLNLPHGGYEHLANLRRRTPTFRLRYVGAYLATAAGFVGLFLLAPVAGLALALAVAVAKGGLGGLAVLEATTGTDHLRTRPQRALAAAVRGGAVMVVPMVYWPETFYGFASLMVGLVDPGAVPAPAGDTALRLLGGGYWLALAAHVGLGYVRGGGRSWLVDAGESVLLAVYFAAVPVLVAVGLYFPLWYSARQVARSRSVSEPRLDGRDLLAGDEDDPAAVARRAWGVLVAGALGTGTVLAAVYLLFPNPLAGVDVLPGAVALWSVFISIIALPHVVVGSVLDPDRGIWHVP